MYDQPYRVSCKVLRILLGRKLADRVKREPVALIINTRRNNYGYWAISVFSGNLFSHYELLPSSWLNSTEQICSVAHFDYPVIFSRRNEIPLSLVRWLRINKKVSSVYS